MKTPTKIVKDKALVTLDRIVKSMEKRKLIND